MYRIHIWIQPDIQRILWIWICPSRIPALSSNARSGLDLDPAGSEDSGSRAPLISFSPIPSLAFSFPLFPLSLSPSFPFLLPPLKIRTPKIALEVMGCTHNFRVPFSTTRVNAPPVYVDGISEQNSWLDYGKMVKRWSSSWETQLRAADS